MARKSGSYKQGYFTTGANATTGASAWLTLMDTDVGTATLVTMTITGTTACLNAGGDTYSSKVSATVAALTLAKAILQLTAIITTALTATVVTDGAYPTIDVIDVSISATMTN